MRDLRRRRHRGRARQIAYTSYPNNLGTTPTNSGGRYDGPAYFMGAGDVASVAGLAPTVRLAAIVNGTSNTVIWGEMIRGRNGTTDLGPNQVYVMSLPAPTNGLYVPLATYMNACQGTTTLAGFDSKGQIWGTDSAGQGGGYSHIMPPNRNACVFQGQPYPIEWGAVCVGASSFHPGGVNVGFLDGSVRFVRDGVDPRLVGDRHEGRRRGRRTRPGCEAAQRWRAGRSDGDRSAPAGPA